MAGTLAARWRVGDSIGIHGEVCDIKENAESVAYILYDRRRQKAEFAKTPRPEILARHLQVIERCAQAVESWRKLPPHQNVNKAPYFMLFDEETPFTFGDYLGGVQLGELIGTPHLTHDLRQALRLAIQLCDGLAHARTHGLNAHGNLKPSNCLLTDDGTLQVTDFGMGEQLRGADARSDIYDFGVLLCEMVTGRRPDRGSGLPPPAMKFEPAVLSALDDLVRQCMESAPELRPAGFAEVAQRLRDLYWQIAGFAAPSPFAGRELEAFHLLNQGAGLGHLGHCQEELLYIDRALALAPHMSLAWSNKGAALSVLKRDEDALICLEHAMALDGASPAALTHKAHSLMNLNRHEEALACLERALNLAPHSARAWIKKGSCLSDLKRGDESTCDRHALELAIRSESVWEDKHEGIPLRDRLSIANVKKGGALARQSRFEEALSCFERAIELSPDWTAARVYRDNALMELKRSQEAGN